MSSLSLYTNARLSWRNAKTVETACQFAALCAEIALSFATKQEAGATRWLELAAQSEAGYQTDGYCVAQGALCTQTAANARRHAKAFMNWRTIVMNRYPPDMPAAVAREDVVWTVED